jgi:hypothetical protein
MTQGTETLDLQQDVLPSYYPPSFLLLGFEPYIPFSENKNLQTTCPEQNKIEKKIKYSTQFIRVKQNIVL